MAWKPDYATLAEGRAYLKITDAADTEADTSISLAITTISRLIDHYCNRQFGLVTGSTTRYYTAEKRYMATDYLVDIDDLSSISGLAIASTPIGGSPTTLTDYQLWPLNAIADGKPLTTLILPSAPSLDAGAIGVTSAYFGWSAVPSTIKAATLLQMSRLIKRRDAPFGVAGSPDMGNEIRLLAKLDVDVAVIIQPYVRHWA